MIAQDELVPYQKQLGEAVKTRDMHLHGLPWPTEILESLGDVPVTMRVTLSYFIEPNPGDRGVADKYAYQSHALRFAVRRPLETEQKFRVRINARAQAGEEGIRGNAPEDNRWFEDKKNKPHFPVAHRVCRTRLRRGDQTLKEDGDGHRDIVDARHG